MLAEVEKKVEASLVEKLKSQVIELTKTLEAGEEEKESTAFEREFAQTEASKYKAVINNQNDNKNRKSKDWK